MCYDHGNLIEIKIVNNLSSKSELFRICLFDAWSIGTDEKQTKIKKFITDQAINMLFLTETWLRPFDDEIKCTNLMPSGYTVNSFARNSGGGGITVLAMNSIAHRITYTSKFTFNHTSFELVHVTLVLHNQTINFFCIYRPPLSHKNKLNLTLFLEEFPNLLDFSNSITGKMIILGDFNLHFDQPNSPDVSKILDSIQMFDLMQTVDKPTHRCGHILDWILHRRDDDILRTTHVSHQLTSDHFFIVCDLDLFVPSPPPTFMCKRKLSPIDNCKLNCKKTMS